MTALDGCPETDPATTEQLILREALVNAERHAGASAVRVRRENESERLHVSEEDDGRGFDPEQLARPGHFGLSSMRERP